MFPIPTNNFEILHVSNFPKMNFLAKNITVLYLISIALKLDVACLFQIELGNSTVD